MSASSTAIAERGTDEWARAVVAIQEVERRRIARDLHDVVGQALTAVRLHLALIRGDPWSPGDVFFEVDQAVELVDAALREVRELAAEIRPAILDDLGLVAAARSCLARQARISGFRAEFVSDLADEAFGLEVDAACLRTLQEALTNVSRHADASWVQVRLTTADDRLVLEVRDDGVGFDPDVIRSGPTGSSLGLLGAWERIALVGGSLTIDSAPGQGTVLCASFPRTALRRSARPIGRRRPG
jgi:signal transduction histidine kinase